MPMNASKSPAPGVACYRVAHFKGESAKRIQKRIVRVYTRVPADRIHDAFGDLSLTPNPVRASTTTAALQSPVKAGPPQKSKPLS